MSNYAQTTLFGPKDILPTGNPAKTIFGAAYDVEFGNIATAIASKPDNLTPASFLNLNVTGSSPPANGLYLPALHTLGITANSTLEGEFNGGMILGSPTGSFKGVGTLNVSSNLYVNNVAVITTATVPVSANPSATIGLSAVNGTATTFMTSDSAPPLSQAIVPTWTGAHTFSPGSGTAVTINATSGNFAAILNGASGSWAGILFEENGTSKWSIREGNAASGTLSFVSNTTGAAQVLFAGSGAVTINAPSTGTALTVTGVAGFDALSSTTVSAAGSGYAGRFQGGTGAARDILAAQMNGFSNGFTVKYDGTQMQYSFLNGNVVIGAPSSGTALKVSGVAASTILNLVAADSASTAASITDGGANATSASWFTTNAGVWIATTGTAAVPFTVRTGGSDRLVVGATGSVTVNAPTSGTALTVNGVAGSSVLVVNGGNVAGSFVQWSTTATNYGSIGAAGALITGGSNTDFGINANNGLNFGTNNGTSRLTISTNGNVAVAAPTSGQAFAVTGLANQYAVSILSGNTSGQDFGLTIQAGSTAADAALNVISRSGSITFLNINGDGSGLIGATATAGIQWTNVGATTINSSSGTPLTVKANGTAIFEALGTTAPTVEAYGPTAAALVDMTPDTGTFTITYKDNAGANSLGTGTARWIKSGNFCLLFFPTISAASAAGTDFTATGLPAVIQPTRTQLMAGPTGAFQNNSVPTGNSEAVQVTAASGTVTFWTNASTGGWTASGTKGIIQPFSVVYMLN